MQKEIKRKAKTYGIMAVLLALILGVLVYNLGVVPQIPLTTASTLKTFSSEEQLKNFLESNYKSNQSQYIPFYGPLNKLNSFIASVPAMNGFVFSVSTNPSAISLSASSVATESSYSTTNVQVAGVDELDTVKTDGEYIYTVSGNTVFIVNASLSNAGVVAKIVCDDFAPYGIFVSGDKLAVIGSNYSFPVIMPFPSSTVGSSPNNNSSINNNTGASNSMAEDIYVSESQTYVRVYDISDRANPNLLRNFTMTGDYVDSRMIGNYIYLVSTTPAYLIDGTVIRPTIYSNDSGNEIPATQIYYSNASDAYLAYSTFVALNIQDASQEPSTLTILMGQASNMYVSPDNIYVTFPGLADDTTICRIQVQDDNMTAVAQGEVPGQVMNQYSMDEYDGYFRVATIEWTTTVESSNTTSPPAASGTGTANGTQTSNSTTPSTGIVKIPIVVLPVVPILSLQSTNVYVLDMNLTIVGRLENVSAGENFHSARFVGDRCYLVTFEMTDPLFVVDLTNPTSPMILGNLTVSGYSNYLQPYDENHLIGIGKETSESESGYFAWYEGIKIAIFDVTNVTNPVQMWNVTIGDRGSDSPVLNDPKALLFDKQMDLLVIPVTVAEVNQSQYGGTPPEGAYGTQVWQGVYVYNITLSNGLVLEGNITHADTTGLLPPNTLFINRALYIGNILYTISQAKIELNSLTDLSLLKEIDLS